MMCPVVLHYQWTVDMKTTQLTNMYASSSWLEVAIAIQLSLWLLLCLCFPLLLSCLCLDYLWSFFGAFGSMLRDWGQGWGRGGGGSERGGVHEDFFFLRRRPKSRSGFSRLTRRNVPTKFASICNSNSSSPTIMCQCSSIEGMSMLQDQYLYIYIHLYKSCFPCNSFS
jgi:hypothetical protein